MRDNLALEASSLSFTTILAMVPALTIVLSVFAVVPAFAGMRDALKDFAAANFMPVFTDAINNYVGTLVENAGKLTATSILAFLVVALFLVRAIDFSINRIWRGGRRKFSQTLSIYWTLLTLGPLSVGLIVWITSKVIAYAVTSGGVVGVPLLAVYFIFPVLIEIVLVSALFLIVPTVGVRLQDAVIGAVLVTVLFEISKKLFSIFVLQFSNYQALYGALAALPVFMIWIYINWWLVLIGAEFTATLGIVRSGAGGSVPKFMVYLASMTGDTFGSERIRSVRRKPSITIKVSKKS